MAGISPKQGFYLALPILHGIAAIASLVICFYCNVRESSQQARVPVVLPIPSNFSGTLNKEIMYLAGFPWAEDAEFVTHTWNPFALIMTFQWLTAGFALRNVATLTWDGIISSAWCAWLVIGYTLYLAWSFAGFGGPVCVAMFATVTVSYIASLLLCLASVGPPGLGPRRRYDSVPTREPKEDALPVPSAASQAWTSTDGRLWLIPRAIKYLKSPHNSALANDVARPEEADLDNEMCWGVIYRYAEYCVTAPLLFISVVCLLFVDAPAWLFLASYWLIVVCNLFGIILHYNYLISLAPAAGSHTKKRESGSGMMAWLEWVARLSASGPWSDPRSALWYNLQGAWFAILVPVGGLVYIARDTLLNTNIPEIALAMIWNLLISYLMFGIVPSFVYVFNMGKRSLPWLLDILNVSAKFPLPVIIIIGFITRPVSMRPCNS